MNNISILELAERARSASRWTEKLREELIALGEALLPIFREGGIWYEGPVFHDVGPSYHWLACPDGLIVGDKEPTCRRPCTGKTSIENAPRRVLKAGIPALPGFLKSYSVKLKEAEKEYREAAEAAERMRKALTG